MFNKCYMMIGLPGSGKSFEARKIAEKENAIIVSYEEIKKEIGGEEREVFQTAEKRVREALSDGKNVIMDYSNSNGKRRSEWVSRIKKYGAEMIAVFMATPFELCLARYYAEDPERDEGVVSQMYRNFNIPYFYEGWDKIEVVYPENMSIYTTRHIKGLFNRKSDLFLFDQKNPNQSLTLGDHLFKSFQYVAERSNDRALKEAALLHDIGKPKVQRIDDDGNAHYPQHQGVSAYESMFEVGGCMDNSNKLLRAAYIQWHMDPYFYESDKFQKRVETYCGKEFYKNLMLLHEADKFAH